MHYAQRRSPGSNAIGIGLVAALHLGVGYALIHALGITYNPTKIPTTYAKVFDEPKKQEVVIQRTYDVHLGQQKATYIKMPDLIVRTKSDAQPPTGATTDIPLDTQVGPPVQAQVAVADTLAGAKHLAGPPLVYPPRLLTMGLEGWVDVQCDVSEYGTTSNCRMIAHEGAGAFVDEALDYVQATRYSPATRNGVAVSEKDHRFHIVFKLSDR